MDVTHPARNWPRRSLSLREPLQRMQPTGRDPIGVVVVLNRQLSGSGFEFSGGSPEALGSQTQSRVGDFPQPAVVISRALHDLVEHGVAGAFGAHSQGKQLLEFCAEVRVALAENHQQLWTNPGTAF